MTLEQKIKLREIVKEDEEIVALGVLHNAKVEEYMREETKIIRDRQMVNDAKFQSLLREVGMPENFGLIQFAKKVALDD